MKRALVTLCLCVLLTEFDYVISSEFAPGAKAVVEVKVSWCPWQRDELRGTVEVERQILIMDKRIGGPHRESFTVDKTGKSGFGKEPDSGEPEVGPN